MKPYFYILAVLLVGGTAGYFIGQRSASVTEVSFVESLPPGTDEESVRQVMDRLVEAYKLHDPMLLHRDCASQYIEINANHREVRSLERTLISAHETFRSGRSFNLGLSALSVKLSGPTAVVEGHYLLTSDALEEQGIQAIDGDAVWLLSKVSGQWLIYLHSKTESLRK
ncbi:MAG: hypothetical protein AB1898_19305 [Acidobacteriota bacterium]